MNFNQQMGFFVSAGFLALMAVTFGAISILCDRSYKRKINNWHGKTSGSVDEIIAGWSKGLGGKKTDRFPVYSYSAPDICTR